MAEGPKKDTKFKKGHPGGPGRPKKTVKQRQDEKLTKTEAERLINSFMHMDIEDLELILRDKKRKVVEHMIGRVCLKAIKEGDNRRLDGLLDRLIGKVKEVKEIQLPRPTIIERPSGQVIELSSAEVKELPVGDED